MLNLDWDIYQTELKKKKDIWKALLQQVMPIFQMLTYFILCRQLYSLVITSTPISKAFQVFKNSKFHSVFPSFIEI